jgi:replicative DNA helicase
MNESRLIDFEAEQYVVGCILNAPYRIDDIDLRTTEFGNAGYRDMYKACLMLHANGQIFDPMEVRRIAKVPESAITIACAVATTSETIGRYAAIVRQKAITRRVLNAVRGLESEELDGDELLQLAIENLTSIDIPEAEGDAVSASEAMKEMMEQYAAARSGSRSGVLTGHKGWDDYGWIETGDVMTIAARPSMGKSALICWLITALIRRGHRILVFLTEGNRAKLMRRLTSQVARINSRDIRRGRQSSENLMDLSRASKIISDWSFWVDDKRYKLPDIRRQARRMKSKHGIDVVIVDHLQEVRSGQKGSEYEQMNVVVEGLREMAMEAPRVALIQACQLNRECESTPTKRPAQHHLRASGRIEEISDVIALLYRAGRYWPDKPEVEPTLMEVNFVKVRDDETGISDFRWDPGRGVVNGPWSNRSTDDGV